MKKCIICNKDKCENEFAWKSKNRGIKSGKCRECQKEYARKHYIKNIDLYKKRSRKLNPKIAARNRQFVWDYLKKHPCVDCGNDDPQVLDFDHRDSKLKKWGIGQMITTGFSIKKIKEEINKCDVRCCNCHRKKTAKERDWWKKVKR